MPSAGATPDPVRTALLGDRPPFQDSARTPHTVLPLGGVGTGTVGLAADGGLRQWQLHNIGNHDADLPSTFFALRVSRWEPPFDEVRVLQAARTAEPTSTPLITDDRVPPWQLDLLRRERGMASAEFRGVYPAGEVRFRDPAFPLAVSLEAVNPLTPHDLDTSSIPAVMFTFRLRNDDEFELHGTLGAALQNAVGWDGVSPIDGVDGVGYGGNTNRMTRDDGWTSAFLDNHSLPPEHAGAGQLVLAADDDRASVLTQWRHPDEFFAFVRSRALADGAGRNRLSGEADPQRHAPATATGASPAGRTWNTGLAVPFSLQPGEERSVRMVLAWHFPNRYVNFEQFGPPRPEWGRTRFWLGNHYATQYADAADVARRVRRGWDDLLGATRSWLDTVTSSGLDDTERGHLAAQAVPVRSPSCFRAADGRFFGFEGILGASTTMWSGHVGGSCPLNCTHVWNYVQAVARLWPELERSMRETEFEVMQAPEGYIPHRVIAPTYLPQMWGVTIGGPEEPALDGMLGTVLKTYREVRAGAGVDWLQRYWPNVVRLIEHIRAKWCDADGVLQGVQPSTHDIDLTGTNSFQGSLWLAALAAAEAMAGLVGVAPTPYRELRERAAVAYDAALFTGEYYRQVLGPDDAREFQWESGCLSDQLIGQWWAHELGLGHVLPADHVRTALRSVVARNLRHGFADFEHPFRVYADGDDSGLLMCSWPHGGRPEVPTRYADEVWTGSEYQVAAHCLREGLHDEGRSVLAALWARHDGTRRNPYNEIECGDHYVRAMAGWSVLDAMSGFGEDATSASFTFAAAPGRALPFVASSGFGHWDGARLTCHGGTIRVARLTVGDDVRTFDPPRELHPGDVLD